MIPVIRSHIKELTEFLLPSFFFPSPSSYPPPPPSTSFLISTSRLRSRGEYKDVTFVSNESKKREKKEIFNNKMHNQIVLQKKERKSEVLESSLKEHGPNYFFFYGSTLSFFFGVVVVVVVRPILCPIVSWFCVQPPRFFPFFFLFFHFLTPNFHEILARISWFTESSHGRIK